MEPTLLEVARKAGFLHEQNFPLTLQIHGAMESIIQNLFGDSGLAQLKAFGIEGVEALAVHV